MENLNLVKAFRQNQNLAFHYSNYNWFLAGCFLSETADWLNRMALNWLVFTLTDSPFYIGLVEFCRMVPILLFSVFGGVAADKWDKRKMLMVTQFGAMLTTLALAYAVNSGVESFAYLSFFIFVYGIFFAFEIPIRNAMIPTLIPKHAMTSGLSLYSATLNMSRIVGPAIAGIMLGIWSAPTLIFVNALSFVLGLSTLFIIRPVSEHRQIGRHLQFVTGIKEAVTYLKSHSIVFGVFILGIVPMVFGFPYTSLMPAFAKGVLHTGPEGFGLLLAISASGAVVTSILLGWGKYPFTKGRLFVGCIIGFGVGLILVSFSNVYLFALFFMFFVGMASQGYRIIERAIIQESIPDHIRGRILSIVMMDSGFIPLGNLLSGFLGEKIGVVATLCFMGIVCIKAALVATIINRRLITVD